MDLFPVLEQRIDEAIGIIVSASRPMLNAIQENFDEGDPGRKDLFVRMLMYKLVELEGAVLDLKKIFTDMYPDVPYPSPPNRGFETRPGSLGPAAVGAGTRRRKQRKQTRKQRR